MLAKADTLSTVLPWQLVAANYMCLQLPHQKFHNTLMLVSPYPRIKATLSEAHLVTAAEIDWFWVISDIALTLALNLITHMRLS